MIVTPHERRLMDLGIPYYVARRQFIWERRQAISRALAAGATRDEIRQKLPMTWGAFYELMRRVPENTTAPLTVWLRDNSGDRFKLRRSSQLTHAALTALQRAGRLPV